MVKSLLKILCIVTFIYCIYFPINYFHSAADKKEIRISHILREYPNKLDEIRDWLIDENITFEEAAKEFSLDAESKNNKGDIGYNTQNGELDKKFEKVAFNLPLKEISEPVHTVHGWHLIKVTDIKYFSDRNNFAFKY